MFALFIACFNTSRFAAAAFAAEVCAPRGCCRSLWSRRKECSGGRCRRARLRGRRHLDGRPGAPSQTTPLRASSSYAAQSTRSLGRQSRGAAAKILTKGKAKSDLSVAMKKSIEKRLSQGGWQQRINVLQKRLMPKVRKQEVGRKR